jgi:hypothetical protein
MANERYYIVEARLPIQITDAVSVEEAARKAARIIERDHNIDLSNWFLRVFVYGAEEGELGPVEEWFSNPSGSKFRQREQNIERHFDMIKSGEAPSNERDKKSMEIEYKPEKKNEA